MEHRLAITTALAALLLETLPAQQLISELGLVVR